jgi:hypothetical protein
MIGLDSLTKAELDTYRSRLMFETFVHEEYRQNISSYYGNYTSAFPCENQDLNVLFDQIP